MIGIYPTPYDFGSAPTMGHVLALESMCTQRKRCTKSGAHTRGDYGEEQWRRTCLEEGPTGAGTVVFMSGMDGNQWARLFVWMDAIEQYVDVREII